MPSYSSDRFYKDWIYAIDKDFHSSDGTPAVWAPGQPQYNGEEYAHILLPSHSTVASVNSDESLIAVGIEHDIHIYNTDTQELKLHQILKGHISRVDALSFHPTDPGALVSCAMNHLAGSVPAQPAIMFWNLDEQGRRELLTEDEANELGKHAAEATANHLADSRFAKQSPWIMTGLDKEDLGLEFSKAITLQNIKSQCRTNTSLYGRLLPSFGSQIFNSNGRSMAFLPGNRSKSNGDDKWDICIYDTVTGSVRLTLVGHRDAIMWVGFSPDDKFIASVAWDKTFRIWSHASGQLIHTFHSDGQNWTGGFSNNSRFFAGTSGEGRFWIWDLAHGIEVVSHDFPGGQRWCRTLDWSPDDKQLVLGGDGPGRLIVFDIKRQGIVQDRVLSVEKVPEDVRWFAGRMLEVTEARYLPEKTFGKKILCRANGDNAVEVYDTEENRKWRFAPREGVDKRQGGPTFALESKGLIASVNDGSIRFWKLPTIE